MDPLAPSPSLIHIASFSGFALFLAGFAFLAGLSLEAGAGGDGGRVVAERALEAVAASVAMALGLAVYASTARGPLEALAPPAAFLGLAGSALTLYLAVLSMATGRTYTGLALLASAIAAAAASAYTALSIASRARRHPVKARRGRRRSH